MRTEAELMQVNDDEYTRTKTGRYYANTFTQLNSIVGGSTKEKFRQKRT